MSAARRGVTSDIRALVVGTLLAACGAHATPNRDDAGRDAGVDAGHDAAIELGIYVGGCLERRLVDGIGTTTTEQSITCRRNGRCTSLPNGACIGIEGDGGIILRTFCRYDGCVADADCDVGEACECSYFEIRQCVRVNCRVDADCPGNHRCLRTIVGCFDEQLGHVLCTTDEDQCLTHEDCMTSGLGEWCETSGDHRVCTIHTCE